MNLLINSLIFFSVVLLGDSLGLPDEYDSEELENESSSALFECLIRQICECDNVDRYSNCYDQLHPETQDFLVDELNVCEMGVTLKRGKLDGWTPDICTIDLEILKPCYDEVNIKFMNLAKSYAEDPEKEEHSKGFQKARVCGEPNLSACILFPESCM